MLAHDDMVDDFVVGHAWQNAVQLLQVHQLISGKSRFQVLYCSDPEHVNAPVAQKNQQQFIEMALTRLQQFGSKIPNKCDLNTSVSITSTFPSSEFQTKSNHQCNMTIYVH